MCLEPQFNLLLLPLRGISDIELLFECAYLLAYIVIYNFAYSLLLALFASSQFVLPLLQQMHSLCVSGRLFYLQPQLPYKMLDIAYLLSERILLLYSCRVLYLEIHVLTTNISHHDSLPLDSLCKLPLQRNIFILQVLHLLQLGLSGASSVFLLLLVDRMQLSIQISELCLLHLIKIDTLPFIT